MAQLVQRAQSILNSENVTLEAMRLWREHHRKKLDVPLKYARMRHVERAMRPYLEASL